MSKPLVLNVYPTAHTQSMSSLVLSRGGPRAQLNIAVSIVRHTVRK